MRRRRKLMLWSWSGLFLTWLGMWMALWFAQHGSLFIGQ